MKNLFKCEYICWIELKTLWKRTHCLLYIGFKSHLLHMFQMLLQVRKVNLGVMPFQLYHGDKSHLHDPWVTNQNYVRKYFLAKQQNNMSNEKGSNLKRQV